MKFTVAPKTLVAKSEIKMADIMDLQKYNPDALALRDEKGNDVFVFTTGIKGSVGKFGVCFDGVSLDGNEFATATIAVPGIGVDDTCKIVNDIIAPAMKNIIALEEQVADALLELAECRERAESAMEIIA